MSAPGNGFGPRLRAARQAAGINQTALAKAIGCAQSEISRIESGRRDPALSVAIAAARAVGVTIGGLIDE